MNRVRMILVVAAVVVVAALAAVIFVLTRGDDASPPEPRVETAQTETPVPKDEPIVVVPKDNGRPSPPANETNGQREDVTEEPPDEAEQPESPEEAALRREVEERHRASKVTEIMLRRDLGMTPEQLEGVPDAVVEQLVESELRAGQAGRTAEPDIKEMWAARTMAYQEKTKQDGADDSRLEELNARVEELKAQLALKHGAVVAQCLDDMAKAAELLRPYLNGEQLSRLEKHQRMLELVRQQCLSGDFR